LDEQEDQVEYPVVDMAGTDPTFKFQVAAEPGGGGILRCFGCGSCVAACPVKRHEGAYDPRRFIKLVILGLREEVLASPELWYCATCYNCQEVCPMDVRFAEVVCTVKNLAVREGHLPAAMNAQRELLEEHGRLYEVGEFENKKRADLGLPAVAERPDQIKTLLENR
jgi:heterodisulfide reductase subunit C